MPKSKEKKERKKHKALELPKEEARQMLQDVLDQKVTKTALARKYSTSVHYINKCLAAAKVDNADIGNKYTDADNISAAASDVTSEVATEASEQEYVDAEDNESIEAVESKLETAEIDKPLVPESVPQVIPTETQEEAPKAIPTVLIDEPDIEQPDYAAIDSAIYASHMNNVGDLSPEEQGERKALLTKVNLYLTNFYSSLETLLNGEPPKTVAHKAARYSLPELRAFVETLRIHLDSLPVLSSMNKLTYGASRVVEGVLSSKYVGLKCQGLAEAIASNDDISNDLKLLYIDQIESAIKFNNPVARIGFTVVSTAMMLDRLNRSQEMMAKAKTDQIVAAGQPQGILKSDVKVQKQTTFSPVAQIKPIS